MNAPKDLISIPELRTLKNNVIDLITAREEKANALVRIQALQDQLVQMEGTVTAAETKISLASTEIESITQHFRFI